MGTGAGRTAYTCRPTIPPMRGGRRMWWRWVRIALALAIIGGVGWQFTRLLAQPALWDRPWAVQPGWLAVSVACYLLGLACWGAFWLRLLHRVGIRPSLGA